jgi:hypothetical protein
MALGMPFKDATGGYRAPGKSAPPDLGCTAAGIRLVCGTTDGRPAGTAAG